MSLFPVPSGWHPSQLKHLQREQFRGDVIYQGDDLSCQITTSSAIYCTHYVNIITTRYSDHAHTKKKVPSLVLVSQKTIKRVARRFLFPPSWIRNTSPHLIIRNISSHSSMSDPTANTPTPILPMKTIGSFPHSVNCTLCWLTEPSLLSEWWTIEMLQMCWLYRGSLLLLYVSVSKYKHIFLFVVICKA